MCRCHQYGGVVMAGRLASLLLWIFTLMSSLHHASPAPGPGWLSIDCGASAPYDDANGVHWVPDAGFVPGGVAAAVKVPLPDSVMPQLPQLATLRYFPDVGRACYTIPINASQPYLLRWTAYHGGYDNRTEFAFYFSFETYLGDEFAGPSVGEGMYFQEAIFRVPQANVHLCLHRGPSPTQDAFLSSLQLRPLSSTMYTAAQDDTSLLYSLDRFDFGVPEKALVRYPLDPYDRYWGGASSNFTNVQNFVGASSVLDSGFAVDEPPPAVMNTALTAVDNTPMEVDLVYGAQYTNATFLVNFYFAELESNISQGQRRVFNIIVNGVVEVPNFDVYSEAQSVLYKPVEVPVESVSPDGTLNISLAPTPTSTLKPIANAMEVYAVIDKHPGTLSSDVSAIEGVKTAFGLASWAGDPCWAFPYDWLDCNYTNWTVPLRVTAVNLSNYNLTGTIPDSLGDLTNLTSISLDNNKLTGAIPAWLVSLPSLQKLDLHNNNLSGTVPEYNKSILDLRIEGNPNLCVENATNACPTPGKAKKSSTVYIAVGVAVGAVLGIAAAVTLCCLYSAKKKNAREPLLNAPAVSAAKRGSRYTLAQVLAATNHYHTVLGRGGFGPVYYGKLVSGQEVAVKVASVGSSQGSREFINEIELLTRIHHRNLVSLVGYCDEGDNLMLLYEYVPLGTLQEHLYGVVKTEKELFLDWKTRLQIALGAAQGLEYLHVGCNPAIFHRDVKSNNILLGDKLVPKVADFGLSKSTDSNENVSHVSTQVKGTFGYIDPEYFVSNQLTDKSDVYGFGIVLLELICARPPFVPSLPEEERRIDDWVKPYLESNELDQIVDPALGDDYDVDSMLRVVTLAMKSLEPKGVNRPNMSTAVHELREALQMETGADPSNIPPALHQHHSPPDVTFSPLIQSSNANSDVQFSSDGAAMV